MDRSPSSIQALLAELKRRRVFRVTAVYGAVAFVVLQAAELALPRLGLPDWTVTFVLVLALLGLPIAIVLAWAFETSPDGGVRRTRPATEEEIAEIVAEPAGRRWLHGLLAVAGVLLLTAGAWWMGARSANSERAPVVGLPPIDDADIRTLAILPLQNVSGTEENLAIARGIQKDLLDGLGHVGALRLTSFTSVREYEDTPKSLRQIADELGVRYLVEGSVQTSGDVVQFNVALVDADTDERVWSERYERAVTDETLFGVQADVATSVVRALTVRLTPEDRMALEAATGPSNLAARSWYQQGLDLADAADVESTLAARDALNRAVQIDSTFVAAWVQLARVGSLLSFALGRSEALEEAARARARVERTAPDTHWADLARGYYAYYGEGDYAGAAREFEAALEKSPSDADALTALGLVLRRQGKWEESTLAFRQAVRLDPRNVRNMLRLQSLYENLTYLGAFEEADMIIEHALSVDPRNPQARAWKVWNVLEFQGVGAARRLAGEFEITSGDHMREVEVNLGMEILARDYPRALDALTVWDASTDPVERTARLVAKGLVLQLMEDAAAPVVAESALAALDTVPLPPVFRAQTLVVAGRRPEALRLLRTVEKDARAMDDHVGDPEAAQMIVQVHGMLGELDAGLDLLEFIIERPNDDISVLILQDFPLYDVYREDPRFAGLVERRRRFEEENSAWAAALRPWVP